jgi:hypothetical protein
LILHEASKEYLLALLLSSFDGSLNNIRRDFLCAIVLDSLANEIGNLYVYLQIVKFHNLLNDIVPILIINQSIKLSQRLLYQVILVNIKVNKSYLYGKVW